MDNFDFTEEEIRQQLQDLGYYNITEDRLVQFKDELQRLVVEEKSSNCSDSSSAGFSSDVHSREAERPRIPLENTNGMLGRDKPARSTVEHAMYGKENCVDQLRVAEAYRPNDPEPFRRGILKSNQWRDFPRTAHGRLRPEEVGDYSLYSGEDEHPEDMVRPQSAPADTSLNTTGSSERRVMKRKVLRKMDGQPQVFDESVTESESDLSGLQERLQNLRISVNIDRPRTAPSYRDYNYLHRPTSSRSPPPYRLPEDYEAPKALIRPMTEHPHTARIKKSDPVSRYQQYRQSWQAQKAPGEKQHKGLRWNVREHMLVHDEVIAKKAQKSFLPNKYVVPGDKKRKDLRWRIRMDLAQGVLPHSVYN